MTTKVVAADQVTEKLFAAITKLTLLGVSGVVIVDVKSLGVKHQTTPTNPLH